MLEGYVFEDNNRGALAGVTVNILEKETNQVAVNTFTNEVGFFSAYLPIGKTYLIKATKDRFLPQQTMVVINTNNKTFTKIHLTRRSGVAPALVDAVKAYGIDTKKITPNVNPDGVALEHLVMENDIYAEITNATRLVDENYVDEADKELMKTQPMPSNYQSPVKIDAAPPKSGPKTNQDLPNPYDQKATDKIIVPAPALGETIVALAQNNPRTRALPQNYTGYKIEFFTTLSALPASHEIFNRHGNIVLERKANGLFCYLLGDFEEAKLAETFLQESLVDRYPTATLISYENGQRIQEKKSKKAKTKPVSAPPR